MAKYNVFEVFKRQKDMGKHELMTKIAEEDTLEEALANVNKRLNKNPMSCGATTDLTTSTNLDGSIYVSIKIMIQADPIVSYGWYIRSIHDDLGDQEYKIGDTHMFDEPFLDNDRWPDDSINHTENEEENFFK